MREQAKTAKCSKLHGSFNEFSRKPRTTTSKSLPIAEVANVHDQPKRRLAAGSCDCHEWGTEVHGEGRDLAKAQQCTNQGLAGPIAKARRERSISHEKLRGKRRNEDQQARQKLKELRRLNELFFHPEASSKDSEEAFADCTT